MSAMTAPPMLILTLSAPLFAVEEALAAAVLEAEAEATAEDEAAAVSREVGRDMDGLADRMEELPDG
jgi:hypothetical protein